MEKMIEMLAESLIDQFSVQLEMEDVDEREVSSSLIQMVETSESRGNDPRQKPWTTKESFLLLSRDMFTRKNGLNGRSSLSYNLFFSFQLKILVWKHFVLSLSQSLQDTIRKRSRSSFSISFNSSSSSSSSDTQSMSFEV